MDQEWRRVFVASGVPPELADRAAPPAALVGILGRVFRERRPVRASRAEGGLP